MNFKETKDILYKKSKNLGFILPNMDIDPNDFYDRLCSDLELAMQDKEKEIPEVPEVLASHVSTVASQLANQLIFHNFTDEHMEYAKALNYLISNWATMMKLSDVVNRTKANSVLIDVHYSLALNVELLRALTSKIRKIIAFEPKDITLSGMYLEQIDKYFEFVKDNDLPAYGPMNDGVLKELFEEKEEN